MTDQTFPLSVLYILLQCRKKSTGFRPNLLVKILKSTGQTCQICHMYGRRFLKKAVGLKVITWRVKVKGHQSGGILASAFKLKTFNHSFEEIWEIVFVDYQLKTIFMKCAHFSSLQLGIFSLKLGKKSPRFDWSRKNPYMPVYPYVLSVVFIYHITDLKLWNTIQICCSLIDSCLLLYFPAFVKNLGTGKFILHQKAAVNPLTAHQVIKDLEICH